MKYLFLEVSGMICAGCSNAIQTALLHCVGVRKASIDHLSGHAIVAYEPRIQCRYKLIAVIENLGYQVRESNGFASTQKDAVDLDQDSQPQVVH